MSQSTCSRPANKSSNNYTTGKKVLLDNVREIIIIHNYNDEESYYWKLDSKPIEWGSKGRQIIAALRSEMCWDTIDPTQAPVRCTDANRKISFDETIIDVDTLTNKIHADYAEQIEKHREDCLEVIRDDMYLNGDTLSVTTKDPATARFLIQHLLRRKDTALCL
jgi:hypothetical protein